jgi:hypothetical protein
MKTGLVLKSAALRMVGDQGVSVRLRVIIVLLMSLLLTSCGLIPSLPTFGTGEQSPAAPRTNAPEASPSPTAPAPVPVVLIMDASGSMEEADVAAGDVTRMAAARDAAKRFVAGLSAGTPVGLVSYGDRTPEDVPKEQGCTDVSVKVPLGPASESFGVALDGLNPTGWTPISAALTQAIEMVPQGPAYVVLVSDGEDSCAPPEPCEVTRSALDQHPGLVVSTIGVRASSPQLACIARAGKGVYVTADSADQLTRRLEAVRDPSKAAVQLSPQGASGIAPGKKLSEIRERYPDFPEVRAVAGQTVEVVWRECRREFDDQLVLRAIVADGASTIDGIRVGDPISVAAVLGQPVKTETASPGEWRYYVADRAAKLAWRLQVENDRITRIVLCTCLPDPPATLENAVLDTSGLGPIKIGMTWEQLRRNGWLQVSPHCPPALVTSKLLESRGVGLRQDSDDRLLDISLWTPHYATRSGARVGMTFGQLEQIYGSKLEQETKEGYQPYLVAMVRADGREIVFAPDYTTQALTSSTRIEIITVRPYSNVYMYDGC